MDRGDAISSDALAEALAWWVDAGVDAGVAEAPRDWLASPVAPPPPEPVAVATGAMPATIEEFVRWRIEGDDVPEARWGAPRLGTVDLGARPLMVIVDMPESGDTQALLEGAAGRLFDRMLAAAGLVRGDVHLAPLAWGRPPGGAIPDEDAGRLAAMARHHVALAGPDRVLLMGQATSRALLAPGDGAGVARKGVLHHEGREWPAVATWPVRLLIERPAAKAAAWRDLLDVTTGLKA